MSDTASNKAIVLQFYEEAWNKQNLSIVDKTHAPGWRHADPSNPTDIIGGPEGNKARLREVMKAFPDVHFKIEDVVAENEKVVVRFTLSGTHKGDFAGQKATDKRVSIDGIIIHRLENDKIIEDWVVRDTLSLLQQIGVIPMPGQRGQ